MDLLFSFRKEIILGIHYKKLHKQMSITSLQPQCGVCLQGNWLELLKCIRKAKLKSVKSCTEEVGGALCKNGKSVFMP
jgi:aerobic-type carbon monoxide dehydrogenase small subunit (CoxS/CutS family)